MRKNQNEKCLPFDKRNTQKSLISGLLLLLFFSAAVNLFAQQTVSSAGGLATGVGGSVSFTLGQPAYQTHTGEWSDVSEGVQQAYEIYVLTGLEEAPVTDLYLRVYPNPVSDFLVVDVSGEKPDDLSLGLYDVNGSLLEMTMLSGTRSQIRMSERVAATYFVKVFWGTGASKKDLRTFKIIKH